MFELLFIHSWNPPPSLLKKGQELLKFSSPGGWEIFARKVGAKSERGVGVEMGRLTVYCFSSRKVVKRLITSNSGNTVQLNLV